MTRNFRQTLGALGEAYGLDYLERQGFRLIVRNWRTRNGEIDLICDDGGCLVFVEVRTRRTGSGGSSPSFGPPEESITPRKQLRLVQMSEAYLSEVCWDGPWRIDVVALELHGDGRVARINHIRDAVGGVLW